MTPATEHFLLGFLALLLECFVVGAAIGLMGLLIVYGLYRLEKPALNVWSRGLQLWHKHARRFPW